MGRPLRHVHQGKGEKSQPRNRFAKQRPKEAIQAVCFITGFGHHHLVTHQQVGRLRLEQVRLDEQPVHLAPIHRRVEETRHGAVAAARLGSTGDAQHRHPARQRQQGQVDTAQLPQCGRRHDWRQAL